VCSTGQGSARHHRRATDGDTVSRLTMHAVVALGQAVVSGPRVCELHERAGHTLARHSPAEQTHTRELAEAPCDGASTPISGEDAGAQTCRLYTRTRIQPREGEMEMDEETEAGTPHTCESTRH
jgi:hypothetical protein